MSIKIKRLALSTAVLFSAGVLYVAPASAQATRTWVSGVGDDANPCSRTAPCKTFAGAISKTAATGEINCIDPGGFGAVTITKAITIDCADVQAGIVVAGTNGVVINAGAGDMVVLRGLDIDGLGGNLGSLAGVRVLGAKTVIVEDSQIYGWQRGVSVDGNNTNVQLILNDTNFRNNGIGVNIVPSTATTVNFTLDGVKIQSGNAALSTTAATSGVFVSTQGTSPTITGRILNSQISGGTDATAVGINGKLPTGSVTLTVDSTAITDNAVAGIKVSGGTTRVGNSVIAGNGIAVSAAGGSVVSFGNNRMAGNGTDGTFTSTIPTN